MRTLCFLLLALIFALPARASTVAVMYFENQGNTALEPLKVGLTQMLITDLQTSGQFTVVERTRLQEILDELDLGHTGKVTPATAAKVGKLLGAQYLVLGSYFEVMGTLRMDARVVRVETGEIIGSHGVDDTPHLFLQMEKDIASAVQSTLVDADGMGVRSAVPTAPSKVQVERAAAAAPDDSTRSRTLDVQPAPSPPPPPQSSASAVITPTAVVAPDDEQLDAALAFSEGLIHLDKKDVARAREAFQRSVAADPQLDAAREELARLGL